MGCRRRRWKPNRRHSNGRACRESSSNGEAIRKCSCKVDHLTSRRKFFATLQLVVLDRYELDPSHTIVDPVELRTHGIGSQNR